MVDRTTRIGHGSRFPSTQWSLVLAARGATAPDAARAHLESLIRTYWKPVYTYVRRRWEKTNDDAKDLTQSFFTDLLERPFLADVGPQHGRFRTFLRACLELFLRKQHSAARALKRGGDAVVHSLDGFDTPAHESAFEDAWRDAILADAVSRLREECERDDRRAQFAVFDALHLKTGAKPSYAEVAKTLGLSVSDVTNYLSRARNRYKAIVRRIVRDSVSTEADYRDEMVRFFGEV